MKTMKNVKSVKNIKWLKPLICEVCEECEKYEGNPLKPWEGSLFTPSTTELRPHTIFLFYAK